jgi:hypothetical protein
MNTLTWRDVFASLNPSPMFEAVAMLAEELAMNSDVSGSRNFEDTNDADAPLSYSRESWIQLIVDTTQTLAEEAGVRYAVATERFADAISKENDHESHESYLAVTASRRP